MAQDDGIRTLGGACAVVIGALMVIGWVSHEVLRHAIQATPALAAAALCLGRRPWGKWAAAPIFVVWLAIPILIWLYLLHLANIIEGTFSTAETAMTIVLAAASALGLVRIARRPGGTSWPMALGTFVLFAAAQVAAMVASVQPGLSHD